MPSSPAVVQAHTKPQHEDAPASLPPMVTSKKTFMVILGPFLSFLASAGVHTATISTSATSATVLDCISCLPRWQDPRTLWPNSVSFGVRPTALDLPRSAGRAGHKPEPHMPLGGAKRRAVAEKEPEKPVRRVASACLLAAWPVIACATSQPPPPSRRELEEELARCKDELAKVRRPHLPAKALSSLCVSEVTNREGTEEVCTRMQALPFRCAKLNLPGRIISRSVVPPP